MTLKTAFEQSGGGLNNLLEEAHLYQALLDVALDCVPVELKPHLLGVSFEAQTLIVQLDDQIWQTQLRFYEPTLLGAFQANFPHLQLHKMSVKVVPIVEPKKVLREVSSHPSESDADIMKAMSEVVESDALRDALLKLAKRAK